MYLQVYALYMIDGCDEAFASSYFSNCCACK